MWFKKNEKNKNKTKTTKNQNQAPKRKKPFKKREMGNYLVGVSLRVYLWTNIQVQTLLLPSRRGHDGPGAFCLNTRPAFQSCAVFLLGGKAPRWPNPTSPLWLCPRHLALRDLHPPLYKRQCNTCSSSPTFGVWLFFFFPPVFLFEWWFIQHGACESLMAWGRKSPHKECNCRQSELCF